MLHPEADSHGISEPVKEIDLHKKYFGDPLMPLQIHIVLNEKAQEELMRNKLMASE